MKLTGVLKDKVEAAESKEEKKAILLEAGMELTEDELDGVAGGVAISKRIPKKPEPTNNQ